MHVVNFPQVPGAIHLYEIVAPPVDFYGFVERIPDCIIGRKPHEIHVIEGLMKRAPATACLEPQHDSFPRRVQDAVDGEDDPVELVALVRQLVPAGRGQGVEPGAPVVLGRAPGRLDPPVEQEPLQGGIQRALADLQHVAGDGLQVSCDAVAVLRSDGEGLQDEQVEGTGAKRLRRPRSPAPDQSALCPEARRAHNGPSVGQNRASGPRSGIIGLLNKPGLVTARRPASHTKQQMPTCRHFIGGTRNRRPRPRR